MVAAVFDFKAIKARHDQLTGVSPAQGSHFAADGTRYAEKQDEGKPSLSVLVKANNAELRNWFKKAHDEIAAAVSKEIRKSIDEIFFFDNNPIACDDLDVLSSRGPTRIEPIRHLFDGDGHAVRIWEGTRELPDETLLPGYRRRYYADGRITVEKVPCYEPIEGCDCTMCGLARDKLMRVDYYHVDPL